MDADAGALGRFIREVVLPPGMTVTEAANRLAVGRPALSNLLNGRASLSPKMLLRLESTFGADRGALLRLQSLRERTLHHGRVAVRGYVPSFLSITARDIKGWASTMDARTHLPVLLRKLVHATGRDLERVDFPGGDNSQRHGWDGWIETRATTAWVPEGKSGWEFGTDRDPRRKADKDYENRLSVPPSERGECTFVFVTPRDWPGKGDWAARKEALAHGWKAVRAYDASDLEQWLDEAVVAPVWLGEKLPMTIDGVKTLDKCWEDWAGASEPCLSARIFEPAVATYATKLRSWLERTPENPFVVAADSSGEAVAFLACLFRDESISERWGDMAAVFEVPETLTVLADSSAPFIPIMASTDVQEAAVGLYKRMHCVSVCARNAVHTPIDAAPDLLGYAEFEAALSDMGMVEEVERWTRECGRSPTILRRRLSRDPAVKRPPWAADPTLGRRLVPMCLVGAWHTQSRADRKILAGLGKCSYEEIEEQVAVFRGLDDSPVWSVAQHHGVASKVDALYAIAGVVTEPDIRDFLRLAEDVMSESEPAQELAADQRWAAALHGKVREHSAALRNGICETLVLLAIHGNDLFREALGLDVAAAVSALVETVLSPLTTERLQSQQRDLPVYAEAAPETLLGLLEKDSRQDEPAVRGLLKPVPNHVFSDCPRTGLLWALECMAWSPTLVSRVAVLLAQLSRTAIDDNWTNTPFASLAAVLRSWMPQTAATLAEREAVLDLVNHRYPDVGWRLCLGELALGQRMATDSYRPRWRSDASGAGKVVTQRDAAKFISKAADLLLSRSHYDAAALKDLVEHLAALSTSHQSVVWDFVDDWASQASDEDIAEVREHVRRTVLTRRGHRHTHSSTVQKARETYERLRPQDLAVRHRWLFANAWVEESWDEIMEDDLDLKAREKRIDEQRTAAMSEIWESNGLVGVMALVDRSRAADVIGRYAAACTVGASDAMDVLRSCLAFTWPSEIQVDEFMRGYIAGGTASPNESKLILELAQSLDGPQALRLTLCAPFHELTWRLLDELDNDVRDGYWQRVRPLGWTFTETECAEIIDRLLDAGRPRAAFSAMTLQWQNVETSRLQRLMEDVAFVDAESTHYLPRSHEIAEALEELGKRPGIDSEQMARLEFAFVAALEHSQYGVPNLERMVTESPEFFVQVLSACFRHKDAVEERGERQTEDGREASIASAAYTLLRLVKRIPGTSSDGSISPESLSEWLSQTRTLCADAGRDEVGDIQIGELLARAPSDDDGSWPPKVVSEAMEKVASEQLAQGFVIGTLNSRGVFVRGEGGGAQERELAARYRGWAELRRLEYPFVGRVLERVAASYDRDGDRWDAEEKLEKRLNR